VHRRAKRSSALPSSFARAPRRACAGAQPQLRPPALPAPGYAASLRTPAPDAVLADFRRQRGGAPDAALAQAPEEPEGDVCSLRRGARNGLACCPDCAASRRSGEQCGSGGSDAFCGAEMLELQVLRRRSRAGTPAVG